MNTTTAVKLDRTTFRTSRMLDFCSEKELIAQTGHQPDDWPLVIIKELADNALDNCEEAGIAPMITVTADSAGITVEDNGTGIPARIVKGILDFSVRVSSSEAYISPTRGAQGNALKTIVALPFVLDGASGAITIAAQGRRHIITFSADQIRQEPVIAHEAVADPCKNGTKIHVGWPRSASSILINARHRFLQIANDYTWLNPHLTLTTDWFGEVSTTPATQPAWMKWKPSDPTSPHWYDPERFARLIAAYVAHDGKKADRTVREFVSEFRGLSGTAKQKAVLDRSGLARAALIDLVSDGKVNDIKARLLLDAMRSNSKPVKADLLGAIGRDHFAQRFEAAGCEMDSFDYKKIADADDGGVPFLVETAFGWLGDKDDVGRRLVSGVNWAPGIINPFRSLGAYGHSLDTILTSQRIGYDEPVIFVLHVACPRVEYLDRGKSSVVVRS